MPEVSEVVSYPQIRRNGLVSNMLVTKIGGHCLVLLFFRGGLLLKIVKISALSRTLRYHNYGELSISQYIDEAVANKGADITVRRMITVRNSTCLIF